MWNNKSGREKFALVISIAIMLTILSSKPAWAATNTTTTTTFPPWGDTLFGAEKQASPYSQAGVLEIRHLGWSWTPKALRKAVPSCASVYSDDGGQSTGWVSGWTCGFSSDACQQVGGSPFHPLFCMETDKGKPFTIVGPTCWNRDCVSDTKGHDYVEESCKAGGGFYDSGTAISMSWERSYILGAAAWCYYPGSHTVLGPACYGSTCYDIKEPCSSLGSTVFADLYCVLDDAKTKYTVVGPICEPTLEEERCFQDETETVCAELGGFTMGDGLFCVVEGDYSALGPFSFGPIGNYTESDHDAGYGGNGETEVCTSMGGTPFGNGLFCLLPANDFHLYSDCRGGGCVVIGEGGGNGDEKSICEGDFGGRNLGRLACIFQGDFSVGSPIFWGDTSFSVDANEKMAHLGGSFILAGSFCIYGPTCYGSSCYLGDDCGKAGGETVGGIFCAISEGSSTFRVLWPTIMVCLFAVAAAVI